MKIDSNPKVGQHSRSFLLNRFNRESNRFNRQLDSISPSWKLLRSFLLNQLSVNRIDSVVNRFKVKEVNQKEERVNLNRFKSTELIQLWIDSIWSELIQSWIDSVRNWIDSIAVCIDSEEFSRWKKSHPQLTLSITKP